MTEPTDTPDPLVLALARADHDILSFAGAHGLSLDELVAWSAKPQTQRALAGLCVLADVQTQLLLSRYRLMAATRLIGQVTAEDGALPAEQVRKACVDLLKTELTRAEGLVAEGEPEHDEAFDALARALSVPEPDVQEQVASDQP